jgi:hypothetical protein
MTLYAAILTTNPLRPDHRHVTTKASRDTGYTKHTQANFDFLLEQTHVNQNKQKSFIKHTGLGFMFLS